MCKRLLRLLQFELEEKKHTGEGHASRTSCLYFLLGVRGSSTAMRSRIELNIFLRGSTSECVRPLLSNFEQWMSAQIARRNWAHTIGRRWQFFLRLPWQPLAMATAERTAKWRPVVCTRFPTYLPANTWFFPRALGKVRSASQANRETLNIRFSNWEGAMRKG